LGGIVIGIAVTLILGCMIAAGESDPDR